MWRVRCVIVCRVVGLVANVGIRKFDYLKKEKDLDVGIGRTRSDRPKPELERQLIRPSLWAGSFWNATLYPPPNLLINNDCSPTHLRVKWDAGQKEKPVKLPINKRLRI
jgi:hypothetical protein